MSNRTLVFILCGCVMFLRADRESGAQQKSLTERLADAKGATCVFSLHAVGTWTAKGESQAELRTDKLSVDFTSINVDEGSARSADGFGVYDIVVRLGEGALHFIQPFRAGGIYVTTIFAKESHDGRLKAVHTRHEYSDVSVPGFTSRPEQYYGDCEIVQ